MNSPTRLVNYTTLKDSLKEIESPEYRSAFILHQIGRILFRLPGSKDTIDTQQHHQNLIQNKFCHFKFEFSNHNATEYLNYLRGLHELKTPPFMVPPTNLAFNQVHHEVKVVKNFKQRMDSIPALGTYDDIKSKIDDFVEQNVSEVAEKTIATWIRQIVQGKSEQVKEEYVSLKSHAKDPKSYPDDFLSFLHQLTLLIFGLECIRNPSSFVLNAVLLNLIEKGTASWEFLIEMMPMKDAGSVDRARAVNKYFNEFAIAKYNYDDIASSCKDDIVLIQKENQILTQWLKSKGFNIDKESTADLWDDRVIVELIEEIESFYQTRLVDYSTKVVSEEMISKALEIVESFKKALDDLDKRYQEFSMGMKVKKDMMKGDEHAEKEKNIKGMKEVFRTQYEKDFESAKKGWNELIGQKYSHFVLEKIFGSQFEKEGLQNEMMKLENQLTSLKI